MAFDPEQADEIIYDYVARNEPICVTSLIMYVQKYEEGEARDWIEGAVDRLTNNRLIICEKDIVYMGAYGSANGAVEMWEDGYRLATAREIARET